MIVHSGSSKVVDISNGEAGAIKAIIMMTDVQTDKLTFTTDETVTEKTLDGVVLLVGAGLAEILGTPLNKITFANAETTQDVTVTILVARTVLEAPVG